MRGLERLRFHARQTDKLFNGKPRNTSFLGVLLELAAIPLPWMRPRELVAATGGIKHSVALT